LNFGIDVRGDDCLSSFNFNGGFGDRGDDCLSSLTPKFESSLTHGEMGGDIDGVSIENRKVRVFPPSATYEKFFI
jgi:hypothetical protein